MTDPSMQERLVHLLDRYVLRCTPELLEAYGLPQVETLAADAAPSYTLAGIVGFVGDISGTLLLGTRPELLRLCHPLRTIQPAMVERAHLDWVGELANQLMGRLKLRLAQHGVELKFSSPISLTGERMRHLAARGRTLRAVFGAQGEQLEVWIDAELKEEVTSPEAFFTDEEAVGNEGGLMFL